MSRTSVALGFGWFCGAMTQQITDSFAWSITLALLSGISFGVAEAIWDDPNTGTKAGDAE